MQPDFTPPPAEAVPGELDRVFRAYGLKRLGVPVGVGGGTLNWNYRVETSRGAVFARRWRSGVTVERVVEEHQLLWWVAERGVPVVQPLKTTGGATVQALGDALWSVFPWIEGRTTIRG